MIYKQGAGQKVHSATQVHPIVFQPNNFSRRRRLERISSLFSTCKHSHGWYHCQGRQRPW